MQWSSDGFWRYVWLYCLIFLWLGRVENISAWACVNARVCVRVSWERRCRCAEHILFLFPPWQLSPGEAGGGWGIIVVAGWLCPHSSLWECRKWLLYSRHVTALMVTASLWLLCPFLSPSTKSWLCLPLHLTRRSQWVRSIAASVNISLHIWSNTFLLL